MAFKPGQSGNPNGRPAGSKNKNTDKSLLMALIKDLTEGGFDKFKNELSKLSGEKYVEIYLLMYKISLGVDEECEIMANDRLVKLFNEQVKNLKQNI